MNWMLLAAITVSSLYATAVPPPAPASTPELYFLLMNQKMNTTYDLGAVDTLFQRGAAAGYNGVVLYDHNLEALGSSRLRTDYLPNLKQVIACAHQHGLEIVPQIFSFGHSMGMVFYDISLAEPTPTTRSFLVTPDRRSLALNNPLKAPLLNGNFSSHEGDKVQNWQLQELPGDRTFVDEHVVRRAGSQSLRIESNDNGAGHGSPSRARMMQQIDVLPNSSVTASCFVKGENIDVKAVSLRLQLNFDGMSNCNRLLMPTQAVCGGGAHKHNCSFEWRQEHVTCEAIGAHTSLQLWLGMWSNSSQPGRVWFAGCKLSAKSGMSNILRRQGANLTVHSEDRENLVFVEGVDFDPIPSTTQSQLTPNGQFPDSPQTVNVSLPATTRMLPGERVAISYYFVPPGQVAACLTSNASQAFLFDTVRKHAEIFGPGAQYLARYDEIPQMHSCELCRAKRRTAGELLAWHVNQSAQVLERGAHPRRVMIWQDMFDPFVNGNRTSYKGIQGGITGAWKGLPKSWVIANWDHSNAGYNAATGACQVNGKCETSSLRFFESLGFSQLITGYYGSGNGTLSAMTELANAEGVQGLLGMVYGSWASGVVEGDPRLGGGDYSELEAYAAAARKYWPGAAPDAETRARARVGAQPGTRTGTGTVV